MILKQKVAPPEVIAAIRLARPTSGRPLGTVSPPLTSVVVAQTAPSRTAPAPSQLPLNPEVQTAFGKYRSFPTFPMLSGAADGPLNAWLVVHARSG